MIAARIAAASIAALLAFSFSPALLQQPGGTTTAGAASGKIHIETEIQMQGLDRSEGGGYVTWKIFGPAATELRSLIISKYDGIYRPGTSQALRDGTIQDYEADAFIGNEGDVEQALKVFVRGGWEFWGVKEGGGYRPLHDENKPISPEDCEGIIGATASSTDDIMVSWYFDLNKQIQGNYEFYLKDQFFLYGLYQPFHVSAATDYANLSIRNYDVHFFHTQYQIGLQDLHDVDTGGGTMYCIRTPLGEIIKWDFEASNPRPTNRAAFSTYYPLENPTFLFVFLFVLTEVTLYIVNRIYLKYRERAIEKTTERKYWKRALGIHAIVYLMFILFWVFYFFPGLGFVFIGGIFIWIWGIVSMIVSIAAVKVGYDKRLAKIKEEPVIPPPQPRHFPPPEPRPAPPPQQQPVVVNVMVPPPAQPAPPPAPEEPETPEPEPPAEPEPEPTPEPPAGPAGPFAIESGQNYLVLGERPSDGFKAFSEAVKNTGSNGLCVTTTYPSKVRREYKTDGSKVVWISRSTEGDAVDPKRLDFEITREISGFLKENRGGVVLIDGAEYLAVENGFENVSKFLKKMNDLASVNGNSVVVTINPKTFNTDNLNLLKSQFDQVIEGGQNQA